MITIEKPAYNEEYRCIEFRRPDGQGQLNAAEYIAAAEVLCAERNTGTAAQAMISEVAPYNQTQVKYKLSGGTRGTVYTLRFRITTSNGQKLEDTAELKVV